MTSGKQTFSILLTGMLLASLSTASTSIVHAATTIRTIALTGTQAPGTSAGTTFDYLDFSEINETGQVVFQGTLAGPDVDTSNQYGIWTDIGGSLYYVARTGQLAPGTGSGTVFGQDRFFYLRMDDSGQIAFISDLDGPFVSDFTNRGLWVFSPGAINMVARKGQTAPGTNGYFYDFTKIAITGPGEASFYGSTTVFDNAQYSFYGIWGGTNTTLDIVRQSSAPALEPNTGETVNVGFWPELSTMNDNGTAAFYGFLDGDGVTSANDNSIWSLTPSGLHLVARENSPAPGLGPGFYFEDFNGNPHVNDSGQTVFYGYLGGPGVNNSNYNSIWTDTSGQLEMIARDGDPIPGEPAGTNYGFVGIHQLTNNGKTYFGSSYDDQDENTIDPSGVWLHDENGISLIIKEGGHLPGTAPGVVTDSIGISPFNENGQGLINAWLSGPGVDDSNNHGMWSINDDGHTELILRKGDLFDVSNDPQTPDFRTILYTGNAYNMNSHGQFSFTIYFTDGTTGIFAGTLGLPGDLDGDGFVGIDDLNIVLSNWNQNVPPADPASDPSGDGFVGIDDLNEVLGNWNAGTPPTATANIPEPTTLAILGLAGLAFTHRHRHGH